MGNLTSGQLAAIVGGQAIRQVWSIKAPTAASHVSYFTTEIDSGIFSGGAASPRKTVIKAGRRTHKVWNPHPMVQARPEAVRYAIEVANADGFFHRKSGSCWNPYGIYDSAPAECYLVHQLYVWDNAAGSWSEITHMKFEGRVVKVEYSGTAAMTRRDLGGSSVPQEAPTTATITSEQEGAWPVLRRVFTKDDAVRTEDMFSFTVGSTALTTTSISPTTKVHGSGTFTLTVNGTGMHNSNVVLFDGEQLATTFVSSSQLTCSVPAARILTAGTHAITVFRDGPGGSTSNAQTLTVT